MAGYIKVEAEKYPTQALNTQVNKELFYDFKVKCKSSGLPLNIVLETFMRQYANGKFEIKDENVLSWKKDDSETDTLNTTFNKEVYSNFKNTCKKNKYFVKNVIMAFMEEFVAKNYILEYTEVKSTNSKEAKVPKRTKNIK